MLNPWAHTRQPKHKEITNTNTKQTQHNKQTELPQGTFPKHVQTAIATTQTQSTNKQFAIASPFAHNRQPTHKQHNIKHTKPNTTHHTHKLFHWEFGQPFININFGNPKTQVNNTTVDMPNPWAHTTQQTHKHNTNKHTKQNTTQHTEHLPKGDVDQHV